MTSIADIKARVLVTWNSSRTKFKRGDLATVSDLYSENHRKSLQRYLNKTGTIVAVTTPDGRVIRRSRKYHPVRQRGREMTRYYVQFDDGTIQGFHSHYLTKFAVA